MRVPWFQHDSNSLDNGDIYDSIQKFGDAAYVIFFGILELMSQNFDPHNPGTCEVSVCMVERKLCRPWKEIEPALRFYCARKRFSYRRKEVHGVEKIVLKNNKYNDTMSGYAKKIVRKLSEKSPNYFRNNSGPI